MRRKVFWTTTQAEKKMKVIKKGKEKTYDSLRTEKYEFRACGGSIEPDARETPKRNDKK